MHSAGGSTLRQVTIINIQAMRRCKKSGNSAGPSRTGVGSRCINSVARLMATATRAVADMAVTRATGPLMAMVVIPQHRLHPTAMAVAGIIQATRRRQLQLPPHLKPEARLAADRFSKAKESV